MQLHSGATYLRPLYHVHLQSLNCRGPEYYLK